MESWFDSYQVQEYISLLQSIHTSCGAPRVPGFFSPKEEKGKVAGHDVDHWSPLWPKLRMCGTIPPVPTCLHGMQKDNFACWKLIAACPVVSLSQIAANF